MHQISFSAERRDPGDQRCGGEFESQQDESLGASIDVSLMQVVEDYSRSDTPEPASPHSPCACPKGRQAGTGSLTTVRPSALDGNPRSKNDNPSVRPEN